jgi:pilus assembly protein CpaB
MRPARILLLLIALVAGGLAAWLATRGSAPEVVTQVVAPQPATQTQVLVAKSAIGVGQRLTAGDVDWQQWPDAAVRPEYITIAKTPDAPAKIAGAVARFEIFAGEPILDSKLAHADQGLMSAVLDPGMRAVSINISPAYGSGGFIVPNDRVDVLLTDSSNGQSNSRVILSDVKVLALGSRLGQTGKTGAPPDPEDPKSQVFTSDAIATLELTPAQGQTLMTAQQSGKVSLVLRSVADFGHNSPLPRTAQVSSTPTAPAAAPAPTPTSVQVDDNQTVTIVRFGRVATVTPGSASLQSQPVVAQAAYVPPATVVAPSITTAAPVAAAPAPASTATETVTPPVTVVTNPAPKPATLGTVPTIPIQ